jgi:phage-related protein
MAGVATKALNLGGDLEQNLGGSEAVFKDFAGRMQDIGKTAFKDMGLSQSDFLATANKMGALFQGAGFGIEESADLSSKAMQRAADVASIMGINSADAMEAVAGAAKGNFTMMDNLGVAMNDTAIQNYALSKGINKTTSEMTQQEKIALAMEMFLDKTTYAAGNYAKENETLAGSLGTAKAALSNFLSGSGTVDDVVSSFSNAATVIVTNLDELVPKLVTGITNLVKKIVPLLPPLLQSLLPGIINGVVSLINGLVTALPTIINVLMGALPALISGIEQIFNSLVAALPQIMQVLADALPTIIPQLINALISMILTLMQYLPQIIQPIIDNLPEIIISIVNALIQNLPMLINGLVELIIGIVQAIPQIILALIQALPTIYISIIKGLLQALPQLIKGIVRILGEVGKAIWSTLKGIFTKAWNGIKSIFSSVGDFFKGIWNNIKSAFSSVTDWFKSTFSKAWQAVKNVFSSGGRIFDGIKDGISSVFKTVVNAIIKGINKVISVPFNAINTMLGKIRDISILGVSPFSWIKTFNVPQIPQLRKGGVLKKGQTGYLEGDGDEAVVPLEQNTRWISRLAEQINSAKFESASILNNVVPIDQLTSAIKNEVGKRLDNVEYLLEKVINVLKEFFPELLNIFDVTLVMDDGTVAAKLTPKIDKKLGAIYKKKGRGN